MKKFIASLFALLMVLSAMATVKERVLDVPTLPGAPAAGLVKMEKPSDKKLAIEANVFPITKKVNSAAKEDEQTFKVKCIFKYDSERYRPSGVAGYNSENSYDEDYDWENDYIYLDMAPGVYDFRALYQRILDKSFFFGEAGCAYLILEGIEINGDTEIELDASLITETISFETYNPDGEQTVLRFVRYIDENYNWEIISEGNVYDFMFNNYIIHDDYGIVGGNGGNAGGCEIEMGPLGEWKAEWKSNIYINPVSGKYKFAQLRMLYDQDECWLVPMFSEGSKAQLITNEDGEYSNLYDVNFATTPAGKECTIVSDAPYGISWGMYESLASPKNLYGLESDLASFHRFRYCRTQSSIDNPKYKYMMKFKGEDSAQIEDIDRYYDDEGNLLDESTHYATTEIYTPIFVLEARTCNLYPTIDNSNLQCLEGGIEYDFFFQPQLSFEITPQSIPLFGATPQFMRFFYQTLKYSWYEYPFPAISFDSYGYYGDYRSMDNMEISVLMNDKIVATSMKEFGEWQRECMEAQMETGKFSFKYLNENIEIDGLAGKNSAIVQFDNSVKNLVMPLIQAVQFRDKNNCVTDIFPTPSDGKLLIAGGDFYERKGDPNLSIDGEVPCWYELGGCNLDVQYAPYGSNDFTPIEMQPEGEVMIGFGYPFVGCLEGVDKTSATGWFDLRILMTDAAGNIQEQIISPAFKIDSLTGIQQVSANKAGLRVIGKTVVADNGASVEVFTLSGQRVENNALPAGVYIARSGDSVAKLQVK